MKLQDTNVSIETSGDMEESAFGIGDPWLILEYMTKNVYSDIPRVVVQEIASNSRDAHREMGQTRRIRITLPNRFDSTIKFRDFGPGMTPQRMKEVFTQYGKSTKRGDNGQTGGFGIGGKTPWAYSDVFTMRSTSMEDGKLVCREYAAVKAEDRKLKLMEMGKPVTIDMNDSTIPEDDKHTGVIVSMDVRKEDWASFTTKAIEITKYWNEAERPEICGQDPAPQFPDMSVMYEGPGWKLLNTNQALTGKYSYYSHAATVVVDGIPYPLNGDSIGVGYDGTPNGHLRPLLDGRFVYYLGVGELTLALSRENLQYDARTKTAVLAIMEAAYKSLKSQIDDSLKGCLTLRDAIETYQDMQRNFKIAEFVKKATWNGIDVTKDSFSMNNGTCRQYKKEAGAKGVKIRSKEVDAFNINSDTMLCLLDTDQRSVLRIHTLFNENPNLDVIQVVEPDHDAMKWDAYKALIHLDDFKPRLMSTVEKMKRQKVPGSGSTSGVVKAYVFTNCQKDSPREMWDAEDVDLEDGEGIYVTLDRGRSMDFIHEHLNTTMHMLGRPTLIGVPARFAKNIGDGWKTLRDYLEERATELEAKIDFQSIADNMYCKEFAAHTILHFSTAGEMLKPEFLASIDDPLCPLVRWLKRSHDWITTATDPGQEYQTFIAMMSRLGKAHTLPQVKDTIKKTLEECRELYPLVFVICSSYEKTMWNMLKTEIAFYVNQKNQALTLAAVAI